MQELSVLIIEAKNERSKTSELDSALSQLRRNLALNLLHHYQIMPAMSALAGNVTIEILTTQSLISQFTNPYSVSNKLVL
ncbi:MAG: hypothetical protein MUC48_05335 [Leptolyngbya sp. Prado105]|nr:hypothetical protein [Leptolyngbya sp. Prado105]